MALSRWTKYPCLYAGRDVANATHARDVYVALLMASPSHSGDVADDAEARRDLIVEGEIVEIDVILHLIVQDSPPHLVVGSNVVCVGAVSAESDAYGQIMEFVCPIAPMELLLLVCRIQAGDQRLFRMSRYTTLSKCSWGKCRHGERTCDDQQRLEELCSGDTVHGNSSLEKSDPGPKCAMRKYIVCSRWEQ